MTTKFF